jgi:hypothetical protein
MMNSELAAAKILVDEALDLRFKNDVGALDAARRALPLVDNLVSAYGGRAAIEKRGIAFAESCRGLPDAVQKAVAAIKRHERRSNREADLDMLLHDLVSDLIFCEAEMRLAAALLS